MRDTFPKRGGVKVVATYSIKGGVGKTSAAVNLGALAAATGLRTLIWDLDPQGAASFLFRVKPKVKGGRQALVRGRRDPPTCIKGTDVEGLDLLPADFSYRHLDIAARPAQAAARARSARVLDPLDGDYDLAILDCPPSISLVSESVFTAADLLLVPLVPSTLSVRTLRAAAAFLAASAGSRARRARVPVDGRPPPAPAPRAGRLAAAAPPRRRRHGDPGGQRRRADGGAGARRWSRRPPQPGRPGLRRAVGARARTLDSLP